MEQVAQAVVVSRPDDQSLAERVLEYAREAGIRVKSLSLDVFLSESAETLGEDDHVVAVANDRDLNEIVTRAQDEGFSLGVVPASEMSVSHRLFNLPQKRAAQIAQAFSASHRAMDVALCNGEVVLGMVMLGETPFLDRHSKDYVSSETSLFLRVWRWFQLFWVSLRALFGIHPFPVTLVTGRDVTLKTAITGLTVVEHDVRGAAARLVDSSMSAQDGKMSAVIIAPKSVVEYLGFLFRAGFPGNPDSKRLPGAISYIKSDRLLLRANKPLAYFVDGRRREAKEIELVVAPRVLRLSIEGSGAPTSSGEQKDTMKVDNLPVNEARLSMIEKHLPFFTHALEDDFKDLFLLLRDNARVVPHYLVLMVLSSLVAGLGLFLNSAAVIIGAMILAPLMAPIISLSMALLRMDVRLFKASLWCIFWGILLAIGASAFVALIVPMREITPEIAARLQPSLLDMGVAIGSGIAGAYAHARENVMKSLPGVAIAVALVPPLCVVGIGLGWADGSVIYGAALLFLTNLVGIALAGLLTFMVLGYAPVARARRGLLYSAFLALVLAVPLGASFNSIHQNWQAEQALVSGEFKVGGSLVTLSDIQVSLQGDAALLRADVSSARPLTPDDMIELKGQLEERIGRVVIMDVAYRLVL